MTNLLCEYEKYTIDSALVEVRKLLEKAESNKSQNAINFYSTIEETLIALDHAIISSQHQQRDFQQLLRRVELMEYAWVAHLKDDTRHIGISPASSSNKAHSISVPTDKGVSLPQPIERCD